MPSRATISTLIGLASVAAAGPCDIYKTGGTPCVAAHGTTRALYDSYNGPLYQVQRSSDGTYQDIFPLAAGGVADASTQDDFCHLTPCVITTIYDQSPNGNHLTRAPSGQVVKGQGPNNADLLAAAEGAPVTLNGQKAYGVFIQPYTGYRNDNANGTATGNDPQGIYAIMDGTHYNDQCCFDYGNAETTNSDPGNPEGNGRMEAVYLGTGTGCGTGAGNGPWVMADLENGIYSEEQCGENANYTSQNNRFEMGIVKGNNNNTWAIRAGSATSSSPPLVTWWSGPRPTPSYNPSRLEGAIILGIGGDNSDGSQGTFYEGALTEGYPTTDTENAVQSNVAAAGYAITSLTSGPQLTVGSTVSFHVTTPGYTNRYISHNGSDVVTTVVSSSSPLAARQSASWIVRTGLGNSGCFTFESVDSPGNYIRHSNYILFINANDGSMRFADDSTFCPQSGMSGTGSSIRSWSYPTRYWRHYKSILYIATDGGQGDFDATFSWTNDVTFLVQSSLA